MSRFLRWSFPVLAFSPLVMWRMRIDAPWRWPAAGPAWVPVVVAALSIYTVVSAFVIERRFRKEPIARRLRERGRNPERDAAIVGLVVMLSPACWALIGSLFGLSSTAFAWYAAASMVGVVVWGWRYRRVIYAV